MSEKQKIQRTRNYASVVYPDSANDDWLKIISESKVPVFISPIHDQDLNPTGERKKAHYHVLVMFDSVKTELQAREFFESFGGVGCEIVNSTRAYARYLCHLDNPEKHQYDIGKIRQFGGADYSSVIGTMSDKLKHIREMMCFVKDNQIYCFCDLCDYALENRTDWFDCLINSSSYFMKEYLKSLKFKHDMNL